MLLPLQDSVIHVVLYFVTLCPFLFCDRLDGEERAGCFAKFVFLVSRDSCVAIPLSAMGLSAVCDCDTHLLFLGVIHANSDGFGESAHLLGLV